MNRPPARLAPTVAAEIQRGRELVELADCRSCHTARGGGLFAGGRAIPTPFGTFYSPNITPDPRTGLGSWNATDFWHALHNGYSKDGTLLYPTFPYTNYTKISRHDSDAMFSEAPRPATESARYVHDAGSCVPGAIIRERWVANRDRA